MQTQEFDKQVDELKREYQRNLEDPIVAPACQEFIVQLFLRLDALREQLRSGLIRDALRVLHSIKGSGGMFGFDVVARFAEGMETALKTQTPHATVGYAEEVVQFRELCGRVFPT